MKGNSKNLIKKVQNLLTRSSPLTISGLKTYTVGSERYETKIDWEIGYVQDDFGETGRFEGTCVEYEREEGTDRLGFVKGRFLREGNEDGGEGQRSRREG